ncbi:MAG: hypothetical protein P1V18_05075 [Candidatus Gracilibacteria bacterium]|nr:hypothetical protein [Candidatus Gracilibacteria bacterium]
MKKTLCTIHAILIFAVSFSNPAFASTLIGPQIENNKAYSEDRMNFINNLDCDSSNLDSSRIKVVHRRSYIKVILEITPSEDIYIVNYDDANTDYGQVDNPDVIISPKNVNIIYDIPEEGILPIKESRFIPHSWLLKNLSKGNTFKKVYYFRKPFKENLAFAAEDKRSFLDKNITFVVSYIPTKNHNNTVIFEGENIAQKYLNFSINTRGSFIARPCEERRSSKDNSESDNTDIIIKYDPASGPGVLLELLTEAANKIKGTGYTAEDPIITGNGISKDGPGLSYTFLDTLVGPNGEEITWKRIQPCCKFETPSGLEGTDGKTYGLLDRYEVTYEGLSEPVILFVNMYDVGNPKAPEGFTLNK